MVGRYSANSDRREHGSYIFIVLDGMIQTTDRSIIVLIGEVNTCLIEEIM